MESEVKGVHGTSISVPFVRIHSLGKWAITCIHEQLTDVQTERVVARSQRAKHSSSKMLSLIVEPELREVVKSILFAFIVLEARRRQEEREEAVGGVADGINSVVGAVAGA